VSVHEVDLSGGSGKRDRDINSDQDEPRRSRLALEFLCCVSVAEATTIR